LLTLPGTPGDSLEARALLATLAPGAHITAYFRNLHRP
jgi:hypothetical protein